MLHHAAHAVISLRLVIRLEVSVRPGRSTLLFHADTRQDVTLGAYDFRWIYSSSENGHDGGHEPEPHFPLPIVRIEATQAYQD